VGLFPLGPLLRLTLPLHTQVMVAVVEAWLSLLPRPPSLARLIYLWLPLPGMLLPEQKGVAGASLAHQGGMQG
jgi:hypothetical protein